MKLRRRGAGVFAAAVVAAVAVHVVYRLYHLIDTYAVNVYFADQWILTLSMLKESPPGAFGEPSLANLLSWNLPDVRFLFQGGAWFMGLGAPFTEVVYGMTRWSTRAESFAIYGVLVAAMIAALFLKVALFGRLAVADAVIPILFTSSRHIETLIGTPFVSHSALPLLLLVVYCFCWLGRRSPLKYALLLTVNFLLTFTGNGFVAGVMTPPLLALEAAVAVRRGHRAMAWMAAGAVVIAIVTLAAWWVPLVPNDVQPCSRFRHQPVSDYFWFLANIHGMFLGLIANWAAAAAAGSMVLVSMTGVVLYQLAMIVRNHERAADHRWVVVILGTFTLAFCAAAAVGRVCLGVVPSPRYMTLVVPGFLALYFTMLSIRPVLWRLAAVGGFLVALLMTVYPVNALDRLQMGWFRDTKRDWRDCYLATRDSAHCSARDRSVMPPEYAEAVGLTEQLRLLKERRLGFFADATPSVE